MTDLIGKGAFTKVYSIDKRTVLYDTEDPTKYCFAEWLGIDQFYPKIWKDREGRLLGTKYTKITAPKKQLKALHYKYYLELRRVNIIIASTYEELYTKLEGIKYKRLRDSMLNQLEGLANYIYMDSIGFEVSPRNILTDKKGNLITADLFFSKQLLQTIRGLNHEHN